MRTAVERLERLVCAEHCRFYKPWAEPLPRCAAFAWLVRRAAADATLLDTLERLRDGLLADFDDADAAVKRYVCSRCIYFPADCGFRSGRSSGRAVACGGLLVLRALNGRGDVTLEEIYVPAVSKTVESAPAAE